MSRASHPGEIVFVDETAGSERTEPAANVPDEVAFAVVDGEPIPVVRVVAVTHGDKREIRSYGADGALLATTLQLRRP